ncbi:2-dehydropantoate 2-reductase [Myxococcota bacterium]|nr:2-dehydropantoate 2-reductase [Myxococcota bacterium]
MRTLLQGVGGIGGLVAATLLRSGYPELQLVTGNPQLAEAIQRDGLRVTDRDGATFVARPTLPPSPTVPEGGGPYELIILVTQAPRLAEALHASKAQLSPTGVVLCLQNGLPEAHAEAIVGQGRVLGGVVGWAASMTAPGEYQRTTPGAIHLGWPGRPADDRARAIAAALAPTGAVHVTDNLLGVRWSKLAINATITTMGAVAGVPLGRLVQDEAARDLALHIFSEAVEVSGALGVRLESVSGTFPLARLALGADRRAPGRFARAWRHLALRLVGARYGGARSSMLYAIERGRPPEVDTINGEIVRFGAQTGVPTPVNTELVRLIHEIAAKRAPHGFEALHALRDSVMD